MRGLFQLPKVSGAAFGATAVVSAAALAAGLTASTPASAVRSSTGRDHTRQRPPANSGKVSMTAIDNDVRHVLTLKFLAGLFDHPFTDPSRVQTAELR